MKNKRNLHQKKFYSDEQTDKIINDFATAHDMGYAEALREIVQQWQEAYNNSVNVKIDGVIKDGKVIWNKANMGEVTIEEELARR